MKSEPTGDVALHPVQQPVEKLLRDCEVRHERRRGPGGQHRNKTESAVVLLHTPTGIEGQAAERRSRTTTTAWPWRGCE